MPSATDSIPETVQSTAFAPAERASGETLLQQYRKLRDLPWVRQFLDAIPTLCVALNEERQIVYANRAFLSFLGLKDTEEVVGIRGDSAVIVDALPDWSGLRPGEAVACVHAHKSAGGCGTTPFCWSCGAVQAIVTTQREQRPAVNECRMTRRGSDGREEALDLKVWTHPIEVEGEHFVIFSVEDNSSEKRRRAMERIFFHDVLNTAGGIQALSHMIVDGDVEAKNADECRNLLAQSADQLVGEIQAQKMLAAAESGDLEPATHDVLTLEILDLVVAQYNHQELAKRKTLRIRPGAAGTLISTDSVLLLRILGNLVKNALEASGPGEVVTIDCRGMEEGVTFSIHNSAVIPPEAQLQIFQRSYSTKGPGRGLGTYSIKLLAERYLGGEVGFISSRESGTTFWVSLPRDKR
jgi:K+-sensing histidine kinase KdpD